MQDVTKGATQLSSVLDMGYSSNKCKGIVNIKNARQVIHLTCDLIHYYSSSISC